MKIISLITAVLLLPLCIFSQDQALIIAIGDYPNSGGWPDISSENDIPLITSALSRFGIPDDRITILKDHEATFENIKAHFEKLISSAGPGQRIVVHYSGHGQQVADDNGDELDKMDEALVPYDSPLNYIPGVYEGERLLRDDMTGSYITRLREKLGPEGQLVMILDACHSGTGTRGQGKARGTGVVMAPEGSSGEGSGTSGSDQVQMDQIGAVNEADLAPYMAFYAASARELNYEAITPGGMPVGSLSLAVSEAINQMVQTLTAKELFEVIRMKMTSIAPNQQPQFEGAAEAYFLGDGKKELDLKYYIEKWGGDHATCTIRAGMVAELYVGSGVALYRSGDSTALTLGLVTKSELMSSEITWEKAPEWKDNTLYYVRIKKRAAPPLKVSIAVSDADETGKKIGAALAELPYVTVQDEGELYLEKEARSPDGWKLSTKEGIDLGTYPIASGDLSMGMYPLEERIRRFLQCKLLRGLKYESPRHRLRLEFLPEGGGAPITSTGDGTSGQSGLVFKDGDVVRVKVTNEGYALTYFTLLDIQPDDQINVLVPFPGMGRVAEEYVLKPRQSMIIDYPFQFSDPFGTDVIKIIGTDKPIDLGSIIATRGSGSSSASNPIESLLSLTYNPSRGFKPIQTEVGSMAVETIVFRIEPRE